MNAFKRVLNKKKDEGFTLVELLIVIAIIAILAAIAIPQFSKYRTRAYVTEIESDARNIYTAAQAYLTDNPAVTLSTRAMLNTGGYQPSDNISFVDGAMTLSAGNIEIDTTVSALSANKNAVIFYNGRIETPAAP